MSGGVSKCQDVSGSVSKYQQVSQTREMIAIGELLSLLPLLPLLPLRLTLAALTAHTAHTRHPCTWMEQSQRRTSRRRFLLDRIKE